jgi:hypothetical protein
MKRFSNFDAQTPFIRVDGDPGFPQFFDEPSAVSFPNFLQNFFARCKEVTVKKLILHPPWRLPMINAAVSRNVEAVPS